MTDEYIVFQLILVKSFDLFPCLDSVCKVYASTETSWFMYGVLIYVKINVQMFDFDLFKFSIWTDFLTLYCLTI